jgi:uncharacterized protein YjiS (DUF1127 family)
MIFLPEVHVSVSTSSSRSQRPTVRAAIPRTNHRRFSRLVNACRDSIELYTAGRAAIEWLRELDDRRSRDIGLARSQVEAAVYGFVVASGSGEAGVRAGAREHASTVESVPWS